MSSSSEADSSDDGLPKVKKERPKKKRKREQRPSQDDSMEGN